MRLYKYIFIVINKKIYNFKHPLDYAGKQAEFLPLCFPLNEDKRERPKAREFRTSASRRHVGYSRKTVQNGRIKESYLRRHFLRTGAVLVDHISMEQCV